ncbi:MAG: T9SS type A sorting domain-containing protein [Calditrichaeota bacterium]|nr:T9SS type A sorting domain-containing protein [Calditrichota bacterium]
MRIRDRKVHFSKLLLLAQVAQLGLLAGTPVAANHPVRPRMVVTGAPDQDLLGVRSGQRAARHLRILVLRAQFQRDELATTTGDGTFDLRTASEVAIDPPPHNRTYFDNQLRALAHYYRTVSNGKLTLSWEVWPQGEEESYQLPREMKYYSGSGEAATKETGWAHLLADAVQAADSADAIDFSQFDCLMVFHAGVGADFELDLDPTPYDIQSAFVNLSTLRAALGGGDPLYRGIPVNQGRSFVKEGIILPETESQEGYEIGLLGPMAMLLGAQLGLPSLNDTDKNRPGIGRWGLMDQGSMNLQGLVPAQPCAWSKVFLGWEEPVELRGYQSSVPVAAALAKSAPRIYKIPIDAKEYFLVENRQRDLNRDGRVVCRDALGRRVEILEDGRLLPTGWSGTIVQVDEYDFGLPGSGILIWHVDERVIEAGYADNRVNVQAGHRGVDLEECDAAQDIGYYFGFPTYGYDAGDFWDPWWSGNESHKKANSAPEVIFGPSTMPNTRAYSGADTKIVLSSFSDLDSVMTFAVRHEALVPGFPRFFGVGQESAGLAVAPLRQESDTTLIVAATLDGQLFAWFGDGSKVVANDAKRCSTTLSGDTLCQEVALFAEWPQQMASAPALADIDGDGRVEVLAAFASGEVVAWRVADRDHDGRADLASAATVGSPPTSELMLVSGGKPCAYVGTADGVLQAFSWKNGELAAEWSATLFSEPLTGLAWTGQQVVATSASGGVALVSETGEAVWRQSPRGTTKWSEPVLADTDGDGHQEVIVVQADGRLFSLRLGDGALVSGPGPARGTALPGAAAGDVDRDGAPEVVLATTAGLFGYDATAVVANDLSVPLSPGTASGSVPSPPVAGDVDGDGSPEFVAYLPGKGVAAFAQGGKTSPELAFSVGEKVTMAPALHDLDGDGKLELVAMSSDGYLYAWRTDGRTEANSAPWPQYRGNASHHGRLVVPTVPEKKRGRLFVDKSVYCYPNPSAGDRVFLRYQLVEPVDLVGIRVYDLLGEMVTELRGTVHSTGDNEVEWRLDQVQAGVYLGRFEAVKGNTRQVEFVRIAVVR